MLKKYFMVLVTLVLLFSCTSKPQFIIKGEIKNADKLQIKLVLRMEKEYVALDSTIISEGKFELRGSVEFPDVAYLEITEKETKRSFYLENSVITFTGNADSLLTASIKGSFTEDQFVAFNELLKPFQLINKDIEREYTQALQADDKAKLEELYQEYLQNEEKQVAFKKKYIRNHSASFVIPAILRSISFDLEVNELEEFVNTFDEKVKQTPDTKNIIKRISALKNTAIGKKAPDFEQKDPDGNLIKLSDKIGTKLLLIDFWASWCQPCRKENPNIVSVYNEFKDKGFDIVGVSLDNKKENWLKAIEDDKLNWTQISILNSWDNPATEKYAVMSIPANFLLDENGIIVAKNLRKEKLYQKVAELLK